ncbi:macrophage mannose receptor 1-like [Saccoglossus kowalevskii]
MATNDAHVALSEDQNDAGAFYEIVIGGWDNTQSVIRRCAQCANLVEVSTPGILVANKWRGFWITWRDGIIKVGKEDENAFMEWTDPSPLPVNYAGYSTGRGSEGEFKFCTVNTLDKLWIGLHDQLQQMTFQWSDMSPVTYTLWSASEPNNYLGRSEDCVLMYTNGDMVGRWNDEDCFALVPSVCKTAKEVLPPTTPSTGDCSVHSFDGAFSRQGWVGYHTSCYKFESNSKTNWNSAQDICQQSGSSLVTVNDNWEQAFLSSRLSSDRNSGLYWIGLSDTYEVGTYTWVSNEPVEYTNWARGYPEGSQNCAPGWTMFQDSCFYLGGAQGSQSWYEASDECAGLGGHLAVIDSKALNDFLQNFGLTYSWIGLHDVNNEGNFEWVDGTQLKGGAYKNWDNDQPDDWQEPISNEDCVEMRSSGKWNDKHCSEATVLDGFICQLENQASCTSGWWPHGGDCFRLETTKGPKSWYQSSDECTGLGGHLAVIDSQELNDFLAGLASSSFWIGLHDIDNEGNFQWVDGTALDGDAYQNWEDNQPDDWGGNHGGEDCTEMRPNGKWNDKSCSDIEYLDGFICQRPQSQGSCSHGWNKYQDGNCYKLEAAQGPKTWFQASDECTGLGGHLVVISNKAINDFLQSYASTYYWIGLHDVDHEGTFQWVDGTPLDDNAYKNWDDGQPDDWQLFNGEDCVEIRHNNGKWNDKKCTETITLENYICQREMYAVVGDCVAMASGSVATGLWSGNGCGDQNSYICEKLKDGYTHPPGQGHHTIPSNRDCGTGWIGYGYNCFMVI